MAALTWASPAQHGTPILAAATLTEMLAAGVRRWPERVAFTFEEDACGYGELGRRSKRFAAHLLVRGLGAGERVVLAVPNSTEFFTAFFGVLRAGAVAVPLLPESGAGRVLDVARLCGARAVVTVSEAAREALAERAPAGLPILTVAAGLEAGDEPEARTLPPVAPGDLAYIQYTSGSTGDPKGVQLSHANVTANLGQLVAGFEITAGDRFVSWLPVYHDMGLVLMTLVPLALGARLVLLPASLRRVRAWLEAIALHRGTFTAAPDFAWRLALRAAGEADRHDLSSLRVALDAAEPVRAGTVDGFAGVFGLPPGIMIPGYGLAEATVGVSAWPPGGPVKVDGRGLVSVGRPFPGVRVEIRHRGRPAAPGEVGEILVASPANTRGYFANRRATARLLRPGGFLRTGDLGYVDDEGDLYVAGRLKNVILHGGRTLAPQEVEEAVDALPFVRASAAVGVDRGDAAGEQLYLFAEVRGSDQVRGEPAGEELHQSRVVAIVQTVRERVGLRPGRVYLLTPRSIPRTANGKIRYPALRRSYLDGRLRREGRILFPPY